MYLGTTLLVLVGVFVALPIHSVLYPAVQVVVGGHERMPDSTCSEELAFWPPFSLEIGYYKTYFKVPGLR